MNKFIGQRTTTAIETPGIARGRLLTAHGRCSELPALIQARQGRILGYGEHIVKERLPLKTNTGRLAIV